MRPSKSSPSFTRFSELPTEVRLIIWELSSSHPRIVHLGMKRLATDDDPDWWRSVRSDKAIDQVLDDVSESDYGSFDDEAIDHDDLELQVAKERLLTSDSEYRGNISRARARAILHGGSRGYGRRPIAGWDYPKTLYGFRSESPVPGVLLACRESYSVGCGVYTRAFGALGAVPETWFNFSRDTLYLDDLTQKMPDAKRGFLIIGKVLGKMFARDELARIERLAVHRGPCHDDFINDRNVEIGYIPFLQFVEKLCDLAPNVDQLTIVDGHYAHRDRTISNEDRSGEQYVDLKFMKSTFDLEFCWRVNGYRVDAALLHGGIHSSEGAIRDQLGRTRKHWDMIEGEGGRQMPKINVEIVVSTADEEQLLRDAFVFEKERNKGCWFVNPNDPTDFDYCVGDEIDEGDESLL